MTEAMRFIPVYTPLLTEDDARAVQTTVLRGSVSSSAAVVSDFERLWAARCQMPHGVSVSNGTAALELAVRALGVGPGEEVLCPAFTIISCARAIVATGATPVLIDVDAETYNLDIAACQARRTGRTRAVLGVHMYGHPYGHEALSEFARAHGLLVVEDAAQAHGAKVRDGSTLVPCGSLGDVSTFSFYANKPVTTGEGGMVLTRTEPVARRVRELANLAFLPHRRFLHEELAPNYRMSGVEAALGISQVERLEAVIERKRGIAAAYRARLGSVDEFELQGTAPWAEPIFWMNAGVLRDSVPVDAAALGASLLQRGVETRPFFLGMHEQPALLRLGLFEGERYPVTERLSRRGLYLPSGLDLDAEAINYVVDALQQSLVDLRASAVVPAALERPPDPPSSEGAPFGDVYSSAYDALYAEKTYAHEASVLKRCFETFGDPPIQRVLDLGCGTGAHAQEFSRLGYEVVGVDRSAPMLAAARRRLGGGVHLVETDIVGLDLGETFDAVTILFAVLSYQTTTEGILLALETARRHLKEGGLLVFDVWYGPSVMRSPPQPRSKCVTNGDTTWTRIAEARHDPNAQLVQITYDLSKESPAGEERVRETHSMHYFSPHELRLALEMSGFVLQALTSFEHFGQPPRLDDYTVLVVATAR